MKRLIAVVAALAVFVCVAVGFVRVLDFRGTVASSPYVTYPTLDEITNFEFLSASYDERVAKGDNPKLVFGSSELNPAAAGSAHPGALFAASSYGMDVMTMGRAFCTNLWDAIEVGAFSEKLDDKRVVLIPSMQWFMCYRDPQIDFPASFSEGAYRALLDNPKVSEETKQAITDRMAEYGVDRRSGSLIEDPVSDAIDDAVSSLVADTRLGLKIKEREAAKSNEGKPQTLNDTQEGEEKDAEAGGAVEKPDWGRIFADAEKQAKKKSSNREGFADKWYEKKYKKWVAGAQRKWWFEEGKEFSEQELEDFKLLLQVCKEVGVEPLVIVQPVKGVAYDQTVYNRDVRQKYYDMIRSACDEYGVRYADFSDHEYDTYFLRDYSHPSSLGGAYYSKAIYDFYMGSD